MSQKNNKPIYKNNIRTNDIAGVQRLLQRVANALIHDEISESKARALGSISNTLLSSFELDNKIKQEGSDRGNKEVVEDWTGAIIEVAEMRRREAEKESGCNN